MKLVINNTDFGSLGTAVLYSWPNKYLPCWKFIEELPKNAIVVDEVNNPNELPSISTLTSSVIYKVDDYYATYDYTEDSSLYSSILADRSKYISNKVLYYGNKNQIALRDFAEYDFSWLVDKYKFNDGFKISLLNNKSRNIVGKNVDDLAKVEKLMFPTVVNDNTSISYDYFGSITIGTSEFYLFPVNSGFYKIELYEGVVNQSTFLDYDWRKYTNTELTNKPKPALTIYLGPSEEYSNNPGNYYYSEGKYVKNKYLPKGNNYVKEQSELIDSKVVWLVISDVEKTRDINISYKSWKSDMDNAERNKNDWAIRNDEFFSNYKNIDIISSVGEFKVDNRSGVLLGKDKIEVHPILSRKLDDIDSTAYSPYKTYNIGDLVNYGDSIWISITEFNLGNIPNLSSNWVLYSCFDNIFTNRIDIGSNYPGAANIIPSGQININEGESKSFYIVENLGYELDNINLLTPSTTYSTSTVISHDIEGNPLEKTKITINNWSNIISKGQLLFNFKKVKSKISFKLVYNNTETTLGSEINGESVNILGNNISIISENSLIDPNTTFSFNTNNIVKNKVTKVECIYKSYGVTKKRLYNLGDEETVDFSEAIYYIYLEKNTRTIIPVNIANYELSDYNLEVPYNSNAVLEFSYVGPITSGFSHLRIVKQLDSSEIIEELSVGDYKTVGTTNYKLTVNNNKYKLEINPNLYDLIIEIYDNQ